MELVNKDCRGIRNSFRDSVLQSEVGPTAFKPRFLNIGLHI
jgi:hypothetical protein